MRTVDGRAGGAQERNGSVEREQERAATETGGGGAVTKHSLAEFVVSGSTHRTRSRDLTVA